MIPELNFFIQIMKNLSINTSIVTCDDDNNDTIDFNFRSTFFRSFQSSNLYEFIQSKMVEKNIYFVTDPFYCKYICLLLPDGLDHKKIIIGPYCDMQIHQDMILELMEYFHMPSSEELSLRKYYDLVPFILNESYLNSIVYTLADTLWKNSENYKIESIKLGSENEMESITNMSAITSSDSKIDIELIEQKYKLENDMLQIVTHGQIHKLNLFLKNQPNVFPMEKRNPDPLRNAKNYLIISNSIFRKAAEAGGVHPFYINDISKSFALQIEALNSIYDANTLAFTIMKKYCLLVHNNSTSQYSSLIQQVIVMIDSDLSADLSLNTLSTTLNVNASYLSALFKKDLGVTLTTYVTKKRVQYAILLLNTSDLQIQSIATYCGIPDLNYFTKIFKKIVGITPTQYRHEIHKH